MVAYEMPAKYWPTIAPRKAIEQCFCRVARFIFLIELKRREDLKYSAVEHRMIIIFIDIYEIKHI